MKTSFKLGALCLLLSTLFTACQEDDPVDTAAQEVANDQAAALHHSQATVVGKQLDNPYSVANMTEAYNRVLANGKSSDELSIEATHYYVKFFVSSADDMITLENDSLELFDYPLDHEIESYGESYLEPGVEEGEGNWFYTAVPVDYSFPEVDYEIIEDLFLPYEYEDEDTNNGRSTDLGDLLNDIETEALKLTGNYEQPDKDTKAINARSKKYPSGYVRVYDTQRRTYVPVVGVRVRTRRFFKFGYDYTDANGYYRVDEGYRNNPNYMLLFKNSANFKIWSTMTNVSHAEHIVGRHSRYGYDFVIGQSSRAWRFATVNNAVMKYRRYCSRFGIGLPPSALRIAALDKSSGGSSAPMLRKTWGILGFTTNSQLASFLLKANGLSYAANIIATITKFVQPDLIIKAAASQGTADVYETTFHELGHASHFSKVGSSYWVKYINYIITYGSYGDGTGKNSGYCGVGEMWGYYIGARLAEEEYPRLSYYRPNPIDGWIPAVAVRRTVNEAGYSVSNIYSSLNSSVNTIPRLNSDLTNRVGRNVTTVNQIFDDYGY